MSAAILLVVTARETARTMPKRTNRKQQIIEVLKALTAPAGCTVTPSKLLTDTLGIAREVDVVVDCVIDGQVFVQSFEVVGRKRPMDIAWVEQMIGKHKTLSTDRLFLVSWSGFTPDARRRAEATPKVFPVSVAALGGAVSLHVDQVNLTLKRASPHVRLPSGAVTSEPGPAHLAIHSSSGVELGSLWQLATWLLRQDAVGRALLDGAREHPERDKMKWFELKVPLSEPPLDALFVRHEPTGELHRLRSLDLKGELEFSAEPVALEIRSFGDSPFGHGQASIPGVDCLLVASLDTTRSVQAVKVERLTKKT